MASDLEGLGRRLLEESRERWGFYPNIVRAYALAPEVLAAEDVWSHGVMKQGFLPRRLKEAIATTVSRENRCAYCATAHAYAYTIAGGTQHDAEAMLSDEPTLLSESETVALEFARKAVHDPKSIMQADIELLRTYYSDGEIVEIAAVIQQFMGYNWFVTVLGLEVEEGNPAGKWKTKLTG
jgi:uncharacterized peroxidase-related enzyme